MKSNRYSLRDPRGSFANSSHRHAEEFGEFTVEQSGDAAGLPVQVGNCIDNSRRPSFGLAGQWSVIDCEETHGLRRTSLQRDFGIPGKESIQVFFTGDLNGMGV